MSEPPRPHDAIEVVRQDGTTATGVTVFSAGEFGTWGDAISHSFLPLQVHNRRTVEHFEGHARIAHFCGGVAGEVQSNAHCVVRTRRLIAQDRSRYLKAIWQIRGMSQVVQRDETVAAHAGEWVVYDTSEPYIIDMGDDAHFVSLLLPLSEVGGWNGSVSHIASRALPTRGMSQVVLATLRSLLGGDADLDQSGQTLLQDAIASMMGAAISEIDVSCDAERRPMYRMLQMARAYIEKHLTEPTLSVDSVASACGISRRSLYAAFGALDQTPHAYITRRRLALACELLDEPVRRRSITDISYELGFADAAHFSRLFTARYGATPSQWRNRQAVKD